MLLLLMHVSHGAIICAKGRIDVKVGRYFIITLDGEVES